MRSLALAFTALLAMAIVAPSVANAGVFHHHHHHFHRHHR
jgi:hypothetical protein